MAGDPVAGDPVAGDPGRENPGGGGGNFGGAGGGGSGSVAAPAEEAPEEGNVATASNVTSVEATTAPEAATAETAASENITAPEPDSGTPATTAPAPEEEMVSPTTLAPTLPVSSLDLPHSVDIAACRKHLQVVNTDHDNLMNEAEFVKFIHEMATHDANETLANLPNSDIWGNSLAEMPQGVRVLYDNLNQGGAIEIKGYKMNQIPKPTLAQELFLIKVCVHTEITVHAILVQNQQDGQGSVDTSDQVISLPNVEVVTVYSSFSLSNKVGITTATLNNGGVDHNRRGLELAYQTLVTHVVGEQVGMTLSNPVPSAVPSGATAASAGDITRRRRLTVALDQQLPEIYRVDDVPCPGAAPGPSNLQSKWCQDAYGKFLLYLVGENSIEIYDDYSEAAQNATASGDLQQILTDVAPNVEVQVTGAGPAILPPPESLPPTLPPHMAPTASPVVKPEPAVMKDGEPVDRETKMGFIFVLAAILLSVNCCIIGISTYTCYRNRNDDDLDLEDDGFDDMDESYYERKQRRRSKSTRRDDPSTSYYDDEHGDMSSSIAPTLQDIAEANSPAPAPYSSQDAQERERILKGQGSSSKSDVSSSSNAAPTREEIEATLASASGGSGGLRPLAPPSDASSYDNDDDDELRVNEGEMV